MGLRRTGGVVAVVVLMAVLSGCSSEDGLSFDDWQGEVTSICDDYASRAEALLEEQGEPADPAAETADIEAFLPLFIEGNDAIVAVEVPGERPSDVVRFYEDLEASEQAFVDVVAALRDPDQAPIARLLSESEATNAALDQSAEALGVPSCGSGGG